MAAFPAFTSTPICSFSTSPISVCVCFTTINLVVSLAYMFSSNRQILYYQWRTFVFAFQSIVFYIFVQITFYYFGASQWNAYKTLADYPQCVATNPRNPSPPCYPLHYNGFWYFSLFCAQLYGWMILFSLYVYWSNPIMWQWWGLLLRTRAWPKREDIFATGQSLTTATLN